MSENQNILARKAKKQPQLDDSKVSKLALMEQMLGAKDGVSIAELMVATGWQQHSIRGVMAGALKKRGVVITSQKAGGQRVYRGQRP